LGSVKRDFETKRIQMETDFGFTTEGVYRLLKNWHRFNVEYHYAQDSSWKDISIDIETVLNSYVLSPVSRQLIAAHYMLELPIKYAAELTDVPTSKAQQLVNNALETITEALTDVIEVEVDSLPKRFKTEFNSFTDWLDAVKKRKASLCNVPDRVYPSLLEWLTEKNDDKAIETLRQRMYGPPVVEPKPYSVAEYPFYTPQELELMDKRIGAFLMKKDGQIERLTKGQTTVGYRKSAVRIKDKNGQETEQYTLVRSRVWK
jgi:hypothetical protein